MSSIAANPYTVTSAAQTVAKQFVQQADQNGTAQRLSTRKAEKMLHAMGVGFAQVDLGPAVPFEIGSPERTAFISVPLTPDAKKTIDASDIYNREMIVETSTSPLCPKPSFELVDTKPAAQPW